MNEQTDRTKKPEQPRRLYRSRSERIIAGVCGGMGDYFNVDPVLLRAAFVALAFLNGVGVILYIILMIIIPNEPEEAVEKVTKSKPEKKKKRSFEEVAEDTAKEIQDAANRAAKEAKDFASGLNQDKSWFSDKKNILAVVIIVIGVLALLGQILPGVIFNWNVIAALVVILIGLYIIFKS